ncbi:MAG: VWA domain-containing protein, partial [Paraclostridium sp.]
DFFACNDISRINDEELYRRLLNEFDTWTVKARAKSLIK